jgi:hypothetical protein
MGGKDSKDFKEIKDYSINVKIKENCGFKDAKKPSY